MTTAQQRGWGSPDEPGYRQNRIMAIRAGGIVLYVRKEIALLVQRFVDEIVERGYQLNGSADDWGYNNRDIRGRPGVKSNHAWGLAIDLNSSTNPMTEDGHVHTDMPAWVPETAAKYGLFWGGHYSGARKDPMHFEFLGTPDDVSRYPTETTKPNPPPATPPQEEEDDMFILNPVTDEPDTTQYFVGLDGYVALTADEAQQFRNSGFKTKDMEPLAFKQFKQVATEKARA